MVRLIYVMAVLLHISYRRQPMSPFETTAEEVTETIQEHGLERHSTDDSKNNTISAVSDITS